MSDFQPLLDTLKQQTTTTDPGEYGYLLDALPSFLSEPQQVLDQIGNVYAQFQRDVLMRGEKLDDNKMSEVDSRYLDVMLARIEQLSDEPWSVSRPLQSRLMGSCRDNCVLLVSLLRHIGIAARLRYGFIHTCFNVHLPIIDHTIVEYRHETQGRWILVEPMLTSDYKASYKLDIDGTDLDESHFISAADAWKTIKQDHSKRLLFSGFKKSELWGAILIRNNVIKNLVASIEYEPLMWDCWGYVGKKLVNQEDIDKQIQLMDSLTMHDLRDDSEWQQAKQKYLADPELKIGDINCLSPHAGLYTIENRNQGITT